MKTKDQENENQGPKMKIKGQEMKIKGQSFALLVSTQNRRFTNTSTKRYKQRVLKNENQGPRNEN